jgi:hypothetical protein
MAGAAPTRMRVGADRRRRAAPHSLDVRVGADRRRRAAPHSLDVGFGDELTGSEDGAWGHNHSLYDAVEIRGVYGGSGRPHDVVPSSPKACRRRIREDAGQVLEGKSVRRAGPRGRRGARERTARTDRSPPQPGGGRGAPARPPPGPPPTRRPKGQFGRRGRGARRGARVGRRRSVRSYRPRGRGRPPRRAPVSRRRAGSRTRDDQTDRG